VTQPPKSRINYQALTSKAQKNLAQNANQPVDIRKFQPGALCKFDPPSAHHKFDKNASALRSMYKHIFKDQRHNSLTFDGHSMYMDSYLDMSDISSQINKYRDSVMGKSRQDTADLQRYYTKTEEKMRIEQNDYQDKFSTNNSPRDDKLSNRASSIGV